MQLSTFSENGVREIGFDLDEETIQDLKSDWKQHSRLIENYPTNCFAGRGIVICAGGPAYFTCAWVNIVNLRAVGCKLPIEVWYVGKELSFYAIRELENLNVDCRDILDAGPTTLFGAALKSLAILKSKFREILFLDADNNCVKDPTYLFDSQEFKEFGAVFWPDYWYTAKDNPIWKIVESDEFDLPEQESGQILVDKARFWRELNISLYFNKKNKVYHKLLYGDKDTFKFAWLALNSKFFMVERAVGSCGTFIEGTFKGFTMVQHGLNGEVLFLHRNLQKWNITPQHLRIWRTIKRFKQGATFKKIYLLFDEDNKVTVDLQGDVEEIDFLSHYEHFEDSCMAILSDLRMSAFYRDFIDSFN